MFRNNLIVCGALLALSACGSGGSSGGPVPATVSRNTPAVGWSCTGDFCGISYVAGVPVLADLPTDPDLSYGAFIGAGGSGGEMLFAIETLVIESSSSSSVALIRDNTGGTGVLYGRVGETVLPGGQVIYDGDYVGLVTNVVNDDVVFIVNADATLEIDFAGGDVYGFISDRTVLGPSGDPAIGVTSEDVFISGPVNNQGLFSGATSGGDISTFSVTDAQDGTFDGLIAGPEGQLVVGGLDFVHSRSGDDYIEVGAFSMSQE